MKHERVALEVVVIILLSLVVAYCGNYGITALSMHIETVSNVKEELRSQGFTLEQRDPYGLSPLPNEQFKVSSVQEFMRIARLLNQTKMYFEEHADFILFGVVVTSCTSQTSIAQMMGSCSTPWVSEIQYRLDDASSGWGTWAVVACVIGGMVLALVCWDLMSGSRRNLPSEEKST